MATEGARTSVVVLVTSSFPIHNDGSEAAGSFVADLACALASYYQVRVVAPGISTSYEYWCDGVEIYRFASPEKPLSTLKPWRLIDALWIGRVLLGGQRATNKAMRGGIVRAIALWGLPCGEWVRRSASKARVPYTAWMLGSDVWTLGRIPLLRSMLRRVIRQADVAIADGYQLADDASRLANARVGFLPTTRALQSCSSYPPRTFKPYRLLFLGRWHPNKGIDLLLDALDFLSESDWLSIESIEIQGGGGLDRLVKDRINKLVKECRPVILGGYLSKSEAEDAISRADWILIPSKIESIPVVYSDAMKLGRPIVCTPVGDLPRLVRSFGCGILSAKVDPQSFALALRDALHADASSFAKYTETAAKEFSLGHIANQLISSVVPE
ncbi:glycosyltransferase [Dyella sedimenti]|uniref:glycosyltransferase n=1 Tax=Dyella sedimenti TaxID=2919947 RepID=UPI001FAB324F|nr:glycosyltransferase [Dyella sedimenti]